MTTTIQDVRIRIRDTVDPYTYTADQIAGAITDAADWLDVQDIPATCPKYDILQKLVASRNLIATGCTPSPIQQISEGADAITYATAADTTAIQIQQLDRDISDLLAYCHGRSTAQARGGIGIIHGNF